MEMPVKRPVSNITSQDLVDQENPAKKLKPVLLLVPDDTSSLVSV